MKDATALATTLIVGAIAALFVWKGESQFAMMCVVALLPAASGAAASVAGLARTLAPAPATEVTVTKVTP
jgi:hypothetical protein